MHTNDYIPYDTFQALQYFMISENSGESKKEYN